MSQGISRPMKWNTSNSITEPINTKTIDDSCAYNQYLKQTAGPGMYHLHDRTAKESCFVEFPGYLQTANYGSDFIDAESELRRLSYKNSKCPEAKYNPLKNKKVYNKINTDTCNRQLVPEYTRERKACNDITSINVNRFEAACLDLQKPNRIHSNQFIGTQTRNVIKDITRKLNKELPR